jgi:hypothetical protein
VERFGGDLSRFVEPGHASQVPEGARSNVLAIRTEGLACRKSTSPAGTQEGRATRNSQAVLAQAVLAQAVLAQAVLACRVVRQGKFAHVDWYQPPKLFTDLARFVIARAWVSIGLYCSLPGRDGEETELSAADMAGRGRTANVRPELARRGRILALDGRDGLVPPNRECDQPTLHVAGGSGDHSGKTLWAKFAVSHIVRPRRPEVAGLTKP